MPPILTLRKVLLAIGLIAAAIFLIRYYKDTANADEALLKASEGFSNETVEVALRRGGNPNCSTDNGDTPLHRLSSYAAGSWTLFHRDWRAAMTSLLNAGARINARNKSGETPLHAIMRDAVSNSGVAAAEVQRTLGDVVEFLLDHGADPTMDDSRGNSAIKVADLMRDSDVKTRVKAALTKPRP